MSETQASELFYVPKLAQAVSKQELLGFGPPQVTLGDMRIKPQHIQLYLTQRKRRDAETRH